VDLIRGHESYDTKFVQADVWDVASENLPPGIEEGTVDVVLMIFIFSALSPKQWEQAVRNIYRVLKPGGQVLFRDYGRGDLAQVRFKKGRYMQENFYVRGDGTRVYFFEKEELERIWGGENAVLEKEERQATEPPKEEAVKDVKELEEQFKEAKIEDGEVNSEPLPEVIERPAFEIIHIGIDRRMLVNRQRKLKMYRCWMQAVFRKPGPGPQRFEKNEDPKAGSENP
jgi:tRNAThr (cytosine32-N3)-methyltransferase